MNNLFKVQDIIKLAAQAYGLDDIHDEYETYRSAVRRYLKNAGYKAPYQLTFSQANDLVLNNMKDYFFKRIQIQGSDQLENDRNTYNKLVQKNTPVNLTFDQELENFKFDYIFNALLHIQQESFDINKFKKAFEHVQSRLDINGFPLPGYSKALNDLKNTRNFIKKSPSKHTF